MLKLGRIDDAMADAEADPHVPASANACRSLAAVCGWR